VRQVNAFPALFHGTVLRMYKCNDVCSLYNQLPFVIAGSRRSDMPDVVTALLAERKTVQMG
jgi:hypothetical protein